MGKAALFHSTTDPLINPVPATVMVSGPPPVVAEEGVTAVIVGAPAICTGGAGLTGGVPVPAEEPPPQPAVTKHSNAKTTLVIRIKP